MVSLAMRLACRVEVEEQELNEAMADLPGVPLTKIADLCAKGVWITKNRDDLDRKIDRAALAFNKLVAAKCEAAEYGVEV